MPTDCFITTASGQNPTWKRWITVSWCHWSASGILLYRSQATSIEFLTICFDIIFNNLFWHGHNHLALFTHLTFYLLDLRSALPTLDRIVKGFRKLGAISKTRDVLYFQVTSVHDLILLFKKKNNMPGVSQKPIATQFSLHDVTTAIYQMQLSAMKFVLPEQNYNFLK